MKTLILRSGEKIPVIGENTKYWLCEGRQFRKANAEIAAVVVAEDTAEEGAKPIEQPKQKKSAKKTAKKQANAEEGA